MRALSWFGFAPLLITTYGCTVETVSPVPVIPTAGVLIVDWSIDGLKDPNRCAQSASAAIEITVFYTNGVHAGTFQQACTAFSTSITLNPGSYSASAQLIDSAGGARTTPVSIDPFTLNPGDTLDIPVDFPASSFFGPV